MRLSRSFVLGLLLLRLQAARAADSFKSVGPFVPDPISVEHYGPAYRYPQAGWIVLHIEGEPYERGVQHGRLLAPEIAEITRAAAINHHRLRPHHDVVAPARPAL